MFTSGFGSPEFIGGGFGMPEGPAMGFGDPPPFEAIPLMLIPVGPVPWGEDYSPTRYDRSTGPVFGEEGGHLCELRSQEDNAFNPLEGYRVDFFDATGNQHPLTEPGAWAARPGFGSVCKATTGGRSLKFAMPPLPRGHYHLRVTHPNGYINTLYNSFRVTATPYSREVAGQRAGFDTEVYNPYPSRK